MNDVTAFRPGLGRGGAAVGGEPTQLPDDGLQPLARLRAVQFIKDVAAVSPRHDHACIRQDLEVTRNDGSVLRKIRRDGADIGSSLADQLRQYGDPGRLAEGSEQVSVEHSQGAVSRPLSLRQVCVVNAIHLKMIYASICTCKAELGVKG